MALPDTASGVVDNVTTQSIGFAPILKYYFEKCAIAEIIDNNIPTDPRRKNLTHGQAAVAMITGILFQVMQLYRICRFADKTTVLDVLFPGIDPEEYFDDRLADTLDAIYRYGIGNLEVEITRHMIEIFRVLTDICHIDTTSVSTYGKAGHNRDPLSIRITFGHSKKHRDDLKQLVWSMSVSGDCAFPLFQQAYSGNKADVSTYVEQWMNLIDLLDRKDFLCVADCKLISKANVAAICDNEGFFLAPAPMYESYAGVFESALADHNHELLIPYKDRFNRGFEAPVSIEHEGKDYPLRMIILFDHEVGRTKRKGLDTRISNTRKTFRELDAKLNRRDLKNRDAIEKACDGILKKYRTGQFFTYEIINTPVVTYKNKHRGRPSKNKPVEKIAVHTDQFHVHLNFDSPAFDAAVAECGYYPLLTNKSLEELSIEDAMLAHKGQYKNEHTFRRAKGTYELEPIYLHYPERIQAYLFLFKIALQIIVLIERAARQNIEQRNRGLDDFMPNRHDIRNPKSEFLLKEFEHVVAGLIPTANGGTQGFVSELTPLQLDILSILEVPAECYSFQYLFDTG
jgi:transposase